MPKREIHLSLLGCEKCLAVYSDSSDVNSNADNGLF